MVQTNFSVGNSGSLTSVFADIGSGTDSAANTAYTITLTAAIDLATGASLGLLPGSTATLVGSTPFIVNGLVVTGTLVADLNLTGTVTLDDGTLNNVALVTNGGGTITAGLYTGAVLGTLGDAGDSAINAGTILYTGGYAAVEFDRGTVQNGWNGPPSAFISGVAGGVLFNTSGLVQNGGTITSSGTASAGVFMGAGTVDNGQIGDVGAAISGGNTGVDVTGAGVVANDGTVTGLVADGVDLGSGSVQNGASNDVTARIAGGPIGNGVFIGGGGTVGNFGTITGGGASGVVITGGGTLTNGSATDTAALIAGAFDGLVLGQLGAVLNSGTIQAIGSDATQSVIGAFLAAGGMIQNLTAPSAILGVDWGAEIEGAVGTVTNVGLVEASGTAGLGVDLTAGGTVVNGLTAGASAMIAGGFDGVRISAGAAGAGAVVHNDGTIIGGVGVDFKSGATAATGTLTNDGLIESTGGSTGYAVVFGTGAETLVLQSAGTFVGGVLGNNASGSTTLELASGTQGTVTVVGNDSGTVTDSAGSFAFSAIGTLALDTGASWTIGGSGSLDMVSNAGTLAASGGLVTVNGAFANSGSISVIGGTLVAATGVLADPGTISVGPGGTLNVLGGGITAAGTSDITVGATVGASAALNVSGVGAVVNSSDNRITIGSSGQGTALISQGATVLVGTPYASDAAMYLGSATGTDGVVTVTGAGSNLTALGQVDVGLVGTGDLLIENQASVVTGGNTLAPSQGFDVAMNAGASGAVSVSGNGSVLRNSGQFVVGDGGIGELSIATGGTVITAPGTVIGLAGAVVGNTASAAGSSVNVTGIGADWQVGGALQIGNAGLGALAISGGGTVSTGGAIIANTTSASGSSVNVTGIGASWTIGGTLDVGNAGAGALNIAAGATVSAAALDSGIQLNQGANPFRGTGAISLSGPGSELAVSGTVVIADSGTASLSITDGATLLAANMSIGRLGHSSGEVLVSDPGSTLDVSGTLSVGTTLGTGQLTIGPGGTVIAHTVIIEGEIVNESGDLDPNTIVVSSTSEISGTGVSGGVGDVIVNDFIINAQAGKSASTMTVLGTITGTGTLQIESGSTLYVTGGPVGAGQSVVFKAGSGALILGDVSEFGGTIAAFMAGDTILLQGTSIASEVFVGNTLTLLGSGGGTLGVVDFASGALSGGYLAASGGAVVGIACFAEGTRLATSRGSVAVEALSVGSLVRTESGAVRPITWIGHRTVECARHPKPAAVWPVRIAAGAFGGQVPHRDLYLSPDHAVYVNEVLIPVRYLVNGTTIVQVQVDRVTYYHVELPSHDVVLAEGLPTESYLETGDRANFANGGGVVRQFPDFAAHAWEAMGCAPLVVSGPELLAARIGLAALTCSDHVAA